MFICPWVLLLCPYLYFPDVVGVVSVIVGLVVGWLIAKCSKLKWLRFDLSFIIYVITLLAYKKSWKKGAKFTARFEIMFTNAWIIPKPFFSAGCNTKPTLAGLDEDDNIGTLHGTKVHFVKVCFMKISKCYAHGSK